MDTFFQVASSRLKYVFDIYPECAFNFMVCTNTPKIYVYQ